MATVLCLTRSGRACRAGGAPCGGRPRLPTPSRRAWEWAQSLSWAVTVGRGSVGAGRAGGRRGFPFRRTNSGDVPRTRHKIGVAPCAHTSLDARLHPASSNPSTPPTHKHPHSHTMPRLDRASLLHRSRPFAAVRSPVPLQPRQGESGLEKAILDWDDGSHASHEPLQRTPVTPHHTTHTQRKCESALSHQDYPCTRCVQPRCPSHPHKSTRAATDGLRDCLTD
jgi:hypothetical protein